MKGLKLLERQKNSWVSHNERAEGAPIMKNEIKSSHVRTRFARVFALATVAITGLSLFGAAPEAQAQAKQSAASADKKLIAVNDLMWSTSLATSLAQAKLKRSTFWLTYIRIGADGANAWIAILSPIHR